MGSLSLQTDLTRQYLAWDNTLVRCGETTADIITDMADQVDIEALKASIKEAEREVDLAERQVKNKKLLLNSLKKQLQEAVISGVSGLKIKQEDEKVKIPAPPKDEATRKAEVRRRWRILGMKIKFGLGTQAMAVKRRNLRDVDSFIDKESEEATKEDQLDLEGKCMRKKMDKRHFRKGGVMIGSTQGRDAF